MFDCARARRTVALGLVLSAAACATSRRLVHYAANALSCPGEQVSVERLDDIRYQATGCGRSALLACEVSSWATAACLNAEDPQSALLQSCKRLSERGGQVAPEALPARWPSTLTSSGPRPLAYLKPVLEKLVAPAIRICHQCARIQPDAALRPEESALIFRIDPDGDVTRATLLRDLGGSALSRCALGALSDASFGNVSSGQDTLVAWPLPAELAAGAQSHENQPPAGPGGASR
jgi:hypothetical protein